MIRMSVDFPAPFSPSRAWTSPPRTSKLTSLSAASRWPRCNGATPISKVSWGSSPDRRTQAHRPAPEGGHGNITNERNAYEHRAEDSGHRHRGGGDAARTGCGDCEGLHHGVDP